MAFELKLHPYRGKNQPERLRKIAPYAKDFTHKRSYRNHPLT